MARSLPVCRRRQCDGDERNIFLSTMPATRRDRTSALAVVGVSAVLFACAVPFAGVPLTPVPAFVASYQSALAINDLITAVLLFSQFAILRSRALLLLASGYLFTAIAAIVHALTFPGLFAPGGTARRRPADHRLALHDLARRISASGARLCAAERRRMAASKIRARPAGRSSAASLRSAVAISALHLDRHRPDTTVLPILLSGGHYTPIMIGVVSMVWCSASRRWSRCGFASRIPCSTSG